MIHWDKNLAMWGLGGLEFLPDVLQKLTGVEGFGLPLNFGA